MEKVLIYHGHMNNDCIMTVYSAGEYDFVALNVDRDKCYFAHDILELIQLILEDMLETNVYYCNRRFVDTINNEIIEELINRGVDKDALKDFITAINNFMKIYQKNA